MPTRSARSFFPPRAKSRPNMGKPGEIIRKNGKAVVVVEGKGKQKQAKPAVEVEVDVTTPRRGRPEARVVRYNQRAPPPAFTSQGGIRTAPQKTPSSALTAMMHQTMEPVSAALVRLPIVGFMPTVGTALARTVDTYSRDYSKYTTVTQGLDSTLSDRNGLYPIQNDLGVEPVVLLRDPVVSHIERVILETQPGGIGSKYSVDNGFVGTRTSVGGEGIHEVPCLFFAQAGVCVKVPLTGMTHVENEPCYGPFVPSGVTGQDSIVWLDCPDRKSVV